MFNINQFKSNLKIVRPNQFFVELYLPQAIRTATSSITGNINSTIRFRCEATEFPGRTIATIDEQAFGPTIKYAYDITYNDLNLTMIASEDMTERKVFETWIENIITNSGLSASAGLGGIVKYYNDYSGGVVNVIQVNDEQMQIAKCTLNGAFPIGIGPMNLSWEENDSYQRFTVTMAYRYHTVDFTNVSLAGQF